MSEIEIKKEIFENLEKTQETISISKKISSQTNN
jgi:hypothetical protein